MQRGILIIFALMLPDYYDIPEYIPPKKKRNNYPKGLPDKYKRYLISATNKGIIFDISIEDFDKLVSQSCTYCGDPKSGGLDKIDCKGDYVLNNVVPCCKQCNIMKFTYSTQDFLKHVEKIHLYNNP
jgi:5-methylcytosine-specific restriction endonuclease McrA